MRRTAVKSLGEYGAEYDKVAHYRPDSLLQKKLKSIVLLLEPVDH